MNRVGGLGAMVLAGCLAAGCAVGPRYAAPANPPTAVGPFVSTDASNSPAAAPPDQWWRLYQDPVLDGLVQQALTENRDLKAAAANLAYAQALTGEARAGLFPSATLSGGAAYGRSGGANLAAALSGTTATPSWEGSAGATAAYQVDLFGRVRRAIQAARANADAVRAAEDAVRVTVAAETTAAYVNACAYADQIAVARQSLDLLGQSYAIAVSSRSAGAASDLEVERQAALLDQTRATIPALEGQRRSALFELAALIGKTPAEVPVAASQCHATPRITQVLPVGDGASLLRRRPDVAQAERQLAAATARIGVAAADLYPTISLAGSAVGGGPTTASLTSASGLSFSAGPLISWTFPNISVARAHVREAKAQASAALAQFDSVVLRALKEVEQALATYSGEIDRNAALASARVHADEALRIVQVQFQNGAVSQIDLLVAQTTAIDAYRALAQSDQALARDQIAVFQALGGGWEQAPGVKLLSISGR